MSDALFEHCNFNKYQAFIFDMDGTLVDSGKLHEVGWTQTLNRYQIPVERALMRSLAGVPTKDTLEHLIKHFQCPQTASLDEMNNFKEQVVRENARTYVKPTALKRLAEKYHGYKAMSVGTGAYTAEAEAIIALCDLQSLLSYVVGADKVAAPKPAPDTFLLCAELMQVKPENCIVFEDSRMGLDAAASAGMDAVDVLKAFNIENDYFL